MIKWLWFQLLVSSYPFQELVWLILAGIQSKLSRQFIHQKKSTITITSSMNKLVFENKTFTHMHMMCTQEEKTPRIKKINNNTNQQKRPYCTKGEGAGESTPQPWVSCGSSTSSHGNMGCSASPHWCEGPGKETQQKNHPVPPISPPQDATKTPNTATECKGVPRVAPGSSPAQIQNTGVHAVPVLWQEVWPKPPSTADGPSGPPSHLHFVPKDIWSPL